MKDENLYDPLLDCKEEEWANKHLSKKARPLKTLFIII